MSDRESMPLSTRQISILAVLGVIFWFIAAMIVRFGGPLGIFEGGPRVATYAATIPLSYLFILSARLAGTPRDQTFSGVAVMVMSAALLDGVALAWLPSLYGSDPAIILDGAALILWGVGVGLVLGLVMNQPVNS
jgi:hypothetical protein